MLESLLRRTLLPLVTGPPPQGVSASPVGKPVFGGGRLFLFTNVSRMPQKRKGFGDMFSTPFRLRSWD